MTRVNNCKHAHNKIQTCTVMIRFRDKSDGGTYECVATDFLGKTVIAVGTLIVECESN